MEEAQKMPLQVLVATYFRDRLRARADYVAACSSLPYPEAYPLLNRLQRSEGHFFWGAPFGERMLDIIARTFAAQVVAAAAAHDRRNAALMVVEALRMHAAQAGRLPDRLEDVTAVPIPKDPMSGQTFEYELVDGTAILHSPPAHGERPYDKINYHIRLRERE
jgi:hypothetical protein